MRMIKLTMKTGEREGEDDRVEEITTPVYINPEFVRSIHARKANDDGVIPPGTRIEFPNSAALVVQEDVMSVYGMMTAAA